MIYTNLLLFLVAIFLFSVTPVPDVPAVASWWSAVFFLASLFGFDWLCRQQFRRRGAQLSAGYFQTEKRLSVLALVAFAGALYFADLKYYLAVVSLNNQVPALMSIAGLGVFMLYLGLLWRAARASYQRVFGQPYSARAFIMMNFKANLPIVLPWIILSLCHDLLLLVPYLPLQEVLASQWGDLAFFGLFLIFIALFFPPLVRRLWGCRRLPDGPLRRHLLAFCASQRFTAELYLWPLFEGRVLTAGVMGIVPGMRYILLTPAIIETMSMAELEAVMAHEIGHVKKGHLLLYVLLIGGFSLFAGMLAEPAIFALLSREILSKFIISSDISAETILTVVGAVPLLACMILYFRFIFGYFVRNFERQADLHVISVLGDGQALIAAFDKIADISGEDRQKPNWHHFGLGERIACLAAAERDPGLVSRHNRKVVASLILYLAVLVGGFVAVRQIPMETLQKQYEERFGEAVLLQKARQEPEKAIWHRLIGDLMLSQKMEKKALVAYEKAFSLEPANPEIMNNYAWLLLTSADLSLRDPQRALTLARSAAALNPKGHVLDTLATAYWANGFLEEAIAAERQAIFVDPDGRRFYQLQIRRFQHQTYRESIQNGQESSSALPQSR